MRLHSELVDGIVCGAHMAVQVIVVREAGLFHAAAETDKVIRPRKQRLKNRLRLPWLECFAIHCSVLRVGGKIQSIVFGKGRTVMTWCRAIATPFSKKQRCGSKMDRFQATPLARSRGESLLYLRNVIIRPPEPTNKFSQEITHAGLLG
jgi:hypothetical protein